MNNGFKIKLILNRLSKNIKFPPISYFPCFNQNMFENKLF